MTYLPQNKVILYNFLNMLIGPHVSIENLTTKFLWILNIDEQPTVQSLRMVPCFHKGTQKENITWWSEQIFQSLWFLLRHVLCTSYSTSHLFLLSLCVNYFIYYIYSNWYMLYTIIHTGFYCKISESIKHIIRQLW